MNLFRSPHVTYLAIAFLALSACSGGNSASDPTTPDPKQRLHADAGSDQSVSVGTFVTLNGNKSTNANQTGLTYKWTLVKPAGSNTTLSNDTSATTTLTVDVEGTYEATLVVTDARQTNLSSAPDSVQVTATKSDPPPTANAGNNQDVFVNRPVSLDGSGSRASGNKQLTFNWSISQQPSGSTSILNDPTSKTPSFTPDKPGSYRLRLVVNDGTKDSTEAFIIITAAVKPRPTANAGPNQSAKPGTLITLDGRKSASATSDPLSKFSWSFLEIPTGSSATLAKADTPSPTFIADVVGLYGVQLIVNDGTDDSEPKTVEINISNTLPVANAGADKTVSVCQSVTLNGSASTTRKNQPIAPNSYNWSFESKPPIPDLADATFDNPNSVSPAFIANVAGDYKINLFVTEVGDNNAVLQSQTVGVTVRAASTHNPADALPELYTTKCGSCHKLTPKDTEGARSDLAKKGYFELRAVLQGDDTEVTNQQNHNVSSIRFDNDIAFLCNLFQAY